MYEHVYYEFLMNKLNNHTTLVLLQIKMKYYLHACKILD